MPVKIWDGRETTEGIDKLSMPLEASREGIQRQQKLKRILGIVRSLKSSIGISKKDASQKTF